MPTKLVSITKSTLKGKKYTATFENAGKTTKTHFGATGYGDYTTHKDKERRSNYISRHKTNEAWNKPTTAGSLSRHLLWGNSTSLQQNIQAFKRKFRL